MNGQSEDLEPARAIYLSLSLSPPGFISETESSSSSMLCVASSLSCVLLVCSTARSVILSPTCSCYYRQREGRGGGKGGREREREKVCLPVCTLFFFHTFSSSSSRESYGGYSRTVSVSAERDRQCSAKLGDESVCVFLLLLLCFYLSNNSHCHQLHVPGS